MLTMVLWTLLALAAAAAVLVVASVAGGTDQGPASVRAYLDDVRAGVRAWRAERRGEGSRPVAVTPHVDTTIDDFLSATTVQDPAYLAVEDLTETLARARDRAKGSVSGLSRR